MNLKNNYYFLLIITVFLWVAIGTDSIFAQTAKSADLMLAPKTANLLTGEEIDIEIQLSALKCPTDGVDVYLKYPPELLEVIDAEPDLPGVQIQAGKLYPFTMSNNVDLLNGLIDFSQITEGGKHYQGSGTLATIRFRALQKGVGVIEFNLEDTKVACEGTNILLQAQNNQFSITGKAVQPINTIEKPVPTSSQEKTEQNNALAAVSTKVNVKFNRQKLLIVIISMVLAIISIATIIRYYKTLSPRR